MRERTDAIGGSGGASERVVWIAERSYDYSGRDVVDVFATEDLALAWLRVEHAKDSADEYTRPGDIWAIRNDVWNEV